MGTTLLRTTVFRETEGAKNKYLCVTMVETTFVVVVMGRHKCAKESCGNTKATRYDSMTLSREEKKALGADALEVELCVTCYVSLFKQRRASSAVSSGPMCARRAPGFLLSVVFTVVSRSLTM